MDDVFDEDAFTLIGGEYSLLLAAKQEEGSSSAWGLCGPNDQIMSGQDAHMAVSKDSRLITQVQTSHDQWFVQEKKQNR